MSLVNATIPNMLNGVSQQPPIIRLASQCENQLNAIPTLNSGLGKRPPTEHIAKINADTNEDSYVHFINRDNSEKYCILAKDEDITVVDLNGTSKTVNWPDGKTYLDSTCPREDFRMFTVADTTFILNKNKTVAKAGTTGATRPYEAIVFVKQGQYDSVYEVYVNGTKQADYTTPDSVTDEGALSTLQIADALYTDLNANLTGYTVTQKGSVIYIKHATTDFDITVNEPIGGNGLKVFKGKTQKFSDLPYTGFHGFKIEIAGDASSNFDNYWVEYATSSGDDNSEGVWQETVAPGLANELDATTLPHKLIRLSSGTDFEFSENVWDARTVGDVGSAPDPSIIGQKVKDIFFYKNRFGMLSSSNMVLSKSGSFYQFYPSTVTDLLDSTPIDIEAQHIKVNDLKHAVLFNEKLYLFSNFTQFKVDSGGDILTVKTISIDPVSEFENSFQARPVVSAKNIYFTVERETHTGVREFFSEVDKITNDSSEITANVQNYIPKNVFEQISSTQEDILIELSLDERNALYVYNYYWNEKRQKLLSSWHKWTFESGDVVLGGEIIGSTLYLVIKRADGTYLEKMNLQSQAIDSGLNFRVNLDRKDVLTGSYNSGTNKTTWTLAYPVDVSVDVQVIKGSAFTGSVGTKIAQTTRPTTTTVEVTGDFSAGSCFVGIPYTKIYEFTEPQLAVRNNFTDSIASITEGKLKIKNWILQYFKSGAFTVTVQSPGKELYTYKYTDAIIGKKIIGNIDLDATGLFKFSVLASNKDLVIKITNDTHLPSNFLGASWVGDYVQNSRRIS